MSTEVSYLLGEVSRSMYPAELYNMLQLNTTVNSCIMVSDKVVIVGTPDLLKI